MSKVRLYIADMDAGFIARTRDALSGCRAIETVGSAGNGKHALREIIRLQPDVLLTDIPLPELDGVALLRECRSLRRPPAVILCTALYSQATMHCACKYGASFLLCKPIEFSSLSERIMECGANRSDPCPEPNGGARSSEPSRRVAVARELLSELGLPANLDGTAYVIEAVAHHDSDPALMRNLSNGLYAALASRMNTTVPRIERSLRNAIAVAYSRGSLSRHFSSRPTNKQFIEYVMNALD